MKKSGNTVASLMELVYWNKTIWGECNIKLLGGFTGLVSLDKLKDGHFKFFESGPSVVCVSTLNGLEEAAYLCHMKK